MTIDSLGPWQQPVIDLIKAEFAGSRLEFMPLPKGRQGLVVLWKGFYGHDPIERQTMVRSAIDTFGADASRRVIMIITLTPEEAE